MVFRLSFFIITENIQKYLGERKYLDSCFRLVALVLIITFNDNRVKNK